MASQLLLWKTSRETLRSSTYRKNLVALVVDEAHRSGTPCQLMKDTSKTEMYTTLESNCMATTCILIMSEDLVLRMVSCALCFTLLNSHLAVSLT